MKDKEFFVVDINDLASLVGVGVRIIERNINFTEPDARYLIDGLDKYSKNSNYVS